jgi:hypothetical protein
MLHPDKLMYRWWLAEFVVQVITDFAMHNRPILTMRAGRFFVTMF